ncbi:MAG TPA: rhomboid family intramembrane serine protease [Pseudonocardiaceae bacterium]|nr:rhomboid family intramembrane serine protease [Pseudonocardiaceae bacterium]
MRSTQPRTVAGAVALDKPVVVPTLIGINVLVYVITMVQARSVLDVTGANLWVAWAEAPVSVASGDWWQLVTAGFLHNSPIHILFNMIALWVIGKDLERILGRIRFTAVYLVSLLGGGVSVLLFANPFGPVAGASGAVFGLMGGLLVVVLKLKLNPGSVIAMIAINLILSVAIPNISLLGHLGGLVVGALITAAVIYAPKTNRLAWQVGAVVVAVVVLVSMVAIRDPQLVPLFSQACGYGYTSAC